MFSLSMGWLATFTASLSVPFVGVLVEWMTVVGVELDEVFEVHPARTMSDPIDAALIFKKSLRLIIFLLSRCLTI